MSSDESKACLIGVDWGTTSLRAYLLDAQGIVIDQLHTPDGIMHVPEKNYEAVLVGLLEPWLKQADLPVIASGMITSRNGWLETPYLALPANADQLADSLTSQHTTSGLTVQLVTGVTTSRDGAPDVMRGEETQVVGAVANGMLDGLFVMPGTHSKWVKVRNGHIENFSTFMTGEIFAALRDHTILGSLMTDSDFNEPGFRQGVSAGYDAGEQLLHRLFHVRTLPLFDLIDEAAVSDYLSGMLIGAEISGATGKGVITTQLSTKQVVIVGRDSLADRYTIALEALGQKVVLANNGIAAKGHFAIATSAGLI